MLQQDLSILYVKLGKHEHVLEGTLANKVARICHYGHEHLHGRLERDMVIVVYHDGLREGDRASFQCPFEATGIKVF